MAFWFILVALAAVVSAFLILALRRQAQAGAPDATYDLQVYRDQLKAVEWDVARGVLDTDEATRAKTEISRRILAADDSAKQATPARGGGTLWAGAGIVLVLIAGSLALYTQLGAPGYDDMGLQARIEAAKERHRTRPSQAEIEATIPPSPPVDVSADYLTLVERLRTVVTERPDDPKGFWFLASSENNLGNYTAAHQALARFLELTGEDASSDEWTGYAQMMISAAGGYVSPEAEMALRRAVALDPGNSTARYFQGLTMLQAGRPDLTFRLWERLLRDGPPDAPWQRPLRGQIMEVAQLAGQHRYTPPDAPAPRGPSAEDIAAAGEMSAQDRQQMIEGMVRGLAERLGSEGGPPREWAQLISALGVLGRSDEAASIYANAQQVFADDKAALAQVTAAAKAAGVAE